MAAKVLEVEFRGKGGESVQRTVDAAATATERFGDRLARLLEIPPPDMGRHIKVLDRFERDAAAIRERAQVDRLRNEGRTLDAELRLIEINAAAKKAALDKRVQQAVLKAPDQEYARRVVVSGRAEAAAIDEATQAKREGAIGRVAAARDAAATAERERGQREAEAKRKQDQQADREFAAFLAQEDQEKAAKRKQDQQDDRAFAGFLAKEDQDKAAARDAVAGRQRAAGATVQAARENDLRRRADGGDDAAGLDLKRLNVQKQFAAEAEKLRGVMLGQDVLLKDRLAAEAAIVRLLKQEQAEMAKLTPDYLAQAKAEKEKADFAARVKREGLARRKGGGGGDIEPGDVVDGEDTTAGPGGGVLGRLRRTLGRRSTLGQVGMLIRGGGPIAGLTEAVDTVTGLAESAKAAYDERQRTGPMSLGGSGRAIDLARSLPFIGRFVEAGSRIRGSIAGFDGIAQSSVVRAVGSTRVGRFLGLDLNRDNDAQRFERQAAATAAVQQFQRETALRGRQRGLDTAEQVTQVARQAGGLSLDGAERATYDLNTQQAQRRRGLARGRDDEVQQARESARQAAEGIRNDPKLRADERRQKEAELYAASRREILRIGKDYDAREKADAAAAAAEQLDLKRRQYTEFFRAETDFGAQTRAIRERAGATTLQVMQHGFAAELAAIGENGREQVRVEQAAAAQRERDAPPDQRDRVRADSEARIAAIRAEADARRELAVTQAAREGETGSRQDLAGAGDVLAGYEAARVALVQQTTEKVNKLRDAWVQATTAEQRASIEGSLAREGRVLARSTDEQLRLGQLDVLEAEARAGNKFAAAERERLGVEKQIADAMQRQRAILEDGSTKPEQRKAAQEELNRLQQAQKDGITAGIRERQLGLLQQRAQTGRTATERRDARRALADDSAREGLKQAEADAERVLKDSHSTDEQKRAAQDNVKRYIEQSGRQYDLDVNGQPTPRARTFAGQERGLLLSGVTASAASRDPMADVARTSAEAAKETKRLADLFEKWMAENHVRNAGPANPLDLFPTPGGK